MRNSGWVFLTELVQSQVPFPFFKSQGRATSCLTDQGGHENSNVDTYLVVCPQCFWVIGLRPYTSEQEDGRSVGVYRSSSTFNDVKGLVCLPECTSCYCSLKGKLRFCPPRLYSHKERDLFSKFDLEI